jgi:photosystem II stability/assembly factor-like uncharacterized protein
MPRLDQIEMLNALNGWGWIWFDKPALYHTSDGGFTWSQVTLPDPGGAISGWSSAFLDANTAWLSAFNSQGGQSLFHTSDTGQTWESLPATGLENLGGLPNFTFTSASDGFAMVSGVGAGNLYIQLYETHDGGSSFQLVPMLSPNGETGLPPGTLHLCNMCMDAFSFDFSRLVIVQGDMATMQPTGSVNILTSLDRGQTWQPQALPLPAENAGDLVWPLQPHFVNTNDGFLPIRLVNYAAGGTPTTDLMLVYITHDGGQSWQLTPTRIENAAAYPGPQFFSASEGIVQCGETVCVTTDGAQTWRVVASNLPLPNTETSNVRMLTFTDVNHGWLTIAENNEPRYYRTNDGGQNWISLNQ